MGALREGAVALLDLVFPPFCPLCRRRLGPGRRDPLCADCWAACPRLLPPLCRRCGRPLGGEPTGGPAGAAWEAAGRGVRCGACQGREPAFAYARAAVRYEGPVREAIHALKFRGQRPLARPLADLVAEAQPPGLPVGEVDLLVPVPLHPRRRAQRGFNQAELLARRLGRRWGVPHRADALARVRLTRPQTELAPEERRANVREAFRVVRPELVAGRHVLLVDDVLTTGATAEACARALGEAGAGPVGVVTVARAV